MKKILLILVLTLTMTFIFVSRTQSIYALKVDDSTDHSSEKITFLGDSLTAGVALSEQDRWTYLVASELGFEDYLNMGISGSRVTQTDGRSDSFEERVSSVPLDSDYVVIMGGWNDWGNDVLIADFQSALQSTIDYLRTALPNATIIVMTYIDNGNVTANTETKTISDFYDVVKTVADDRIDAGSDVTGKVQFLDMYSIGDITAEEVDTYTLDGLHPNAIGSRIIANMLISFLGGINIDNSKTYTGGLIAEDGTYSVSDIYYYTNPITIEPGKSYVVYSNNNDSTDEFNYLAVPGGFYDADGTFLSDVKENYHIWNVITAPAGADYMILNLRASQLSNFFVREIINKFTVDFESNGGTAVDTLLVENEVIVQPDDPIKTGDTLIGWYTDEEFTNAYDFDHIVDDNITLYAKWLSDESTATPGTITTPTETASLFGIAWYWYAVAIVGGYVLLSNKKVRKSLGMKK